VLRIGLILRQFIEITTPFTKEQLIHQSDLWFNKIISIREEMVLAIASDNKSQEEKREQDGTYTSWGWDRLCNQALVLAMWELGVNQKV